MLVYVEFISRRPHASVEEFHLGAGHAQSQWAREYSADQMILHLGRSWRIGPEPEYLCAWLSPDHDLDRLDDWERVFKAGEHEENHAGFDAVARIDRAGCYLPLIAPVFVTASHYYLEWLEIPADVADSDVASEIERRTIEHGSAQLALLARPVGLLAPGPYGFAAWGLKRWADAGPLGASAPSGDGPFRAIDASLYAPFGEEIL